MAGSQVSEAESGSSASRMKMNPLGANFNEYQQKKTLAKGMMDLALLSANANQLRYVLEIGLSHPYFYPSIFLIGLSLLFQIAVGILLILNSRYNISHDGKIHEKANKINNYTVIGIFLITIINIFIPAFGIANIPSIIPISSNEVQPLRLTVEHNPHL